MISPSCPSYSIFDYTYPPIEYHTLTVSEIALHLLIFLPSQFSQIYVRSCANDEEQAICQWRKTSCYNIQLSMSVLQHQSQSGTLSAGRL